jgi:ferredoxin-type protein NapH
LIPWALIGILLLTILFSRVWCTVLCPTGVLLSLLSKIRLFGYRTSKACVRCARCEQACPTAAAPAKPGAASDACLVCGSCKKACHAESVRYERIGRKRTEASHESPEAATHSRREFLKIAAAATAAAAVGLWTKTAYAAKRILRPPGALPEML